MLPRGQPRLRGGGSGWKTSLQCSSSLSMPVGRCYWQASTLAPALFPLDECAPVVGLTLQGKIPHTLVAIARVRMHVVELQKPGLSAALTRVIDKGAAFRVAIPYLSPHRRRPAPARHVRTVLAFGLH